MLNVSDSTYKWLTLGTVGIGVLASTLDGSIVNLAYPALTEAFNTDPSTVLWVTVAFLIIGASLALPLGALGDMLGRKRLYSVGFAVFTVGLVLSAMSQTIGQLIIFRVLQGIGQGMMVATSNAIVVAAFPDSERGKALGINGALVGVGLASGPILGGLILEFLGWRAIFWTRIPVSIIGLLAALLLLRPDVKNNIRQPFDYIGTIALTLGLSCLLLFINRAPLEGISAGVMILGIVSIVALVSFVIIEKRATFPVFDFSLLTQRLFSMAVASATLHFVAQAAFLFLMPFYLLQGLGLRPIEAGPVLMCLPVTRLFVSPVSGILSDRLQTRTISTLGLIIMAGGYLVLMNLDQGSSLMQIVPGLLLAGIGSSIFLPPNNSVVMGSVPRERLGMASAVIPVVRHVGMSLGITLIGTLYSIRENAHRDILSSAGLEETELGIRAVIGGYGDGFTVAIGFVILAVLCSAYRGKEAKGSL